MKKLLITTALIAVTTQICQAETQTFKTFTPVQPQPYYNNYYNPNYMPSSKQIARLERQFLNKSYYNETPDARISRLEEKIFGAQQTGNLANRYHNLESYLNRSTPGYYNTYNSYNPYYYNNPKQNLWNAFSDFFKPGQVTGLSPSVTNSPFGYQNQIYGNHGNYSYNNLDRQNSATVRILD